MSGWSNLQRDFPRLGAADRPSKAPTEPLLPCLIYTTLQGFIPGNSKLIFKAGSYTDGGIQHAKVHLPHERL